MDRVRKLTREYRASRWAEAIKECRNSGQTIRAWCEENHVSEKSFYYWQRKFREEACQALEQTPKPSLPAFAEVNISQSVNSDTIAATLLVGEMTVRIHNGADTETVEAVIRTLKTLC